MPTSTTWYINKEQTQEILEVVATDAHELNTVAREQLIQMAATIMEQSSLDRTTLDVPESVEVTQPGSRSLKMVVSYPSQGKHNLVSRMVDRRRAILDLVAA